MPMPSGARSQSGAGGVCCPHLRCSPVLSYVPASWTTVSERGADTGAPASTHLPHLPVCQAASTPGTIRRFCEYLRFQFLTKYSLSIALINQVKWILTAMLVGIGGLNELWDCSKFTSSFRLAQSADHP